MCINSPDFIGYDTIEGKYSYVGLVLELPNEYLIQNMNENLETECTYEFSILVNTRKKEIPINVMFLNQQDSVSTEWDVFKYAKKYVVYTPKITSKTHSKNWKTFSFYFKPKNPSSKIIIGNILTLKEKNRYVYVDDIKLYKFCQEEEKDKKEDEEVKKAKKGGFRLTKRRKNKTKKTKKNM
jgi:hypothetical protein